MPNYRRAVVPGGMFFFTLVTDQRQPLFRHLESRTILGCCIRECRQRWPFEMPAITLLPDHLHAIWSLPRGDTDYSKRWAWIKKEYTKRWLSAGHIENDISQGRQNERRHGVWQPRFWEHTIENENDFERHFDYIHYNAVKHQYVRCPHEWPHSSFHRWVKEDVYPWHWACWEDARQTLDFDNIADSVGE